MTLEDKIINKTRTYKSYAVYYTERGTKQQMIIHGCDGQHDALTMFYTIKGKDAFVYDIRRC